MNKLAVLAAAALIVLPLALMLLAAGGESSPLAASTAADPTVLAHDDIPAGYLAWYQDAALTCPDLPGPARASPGRSWPASAPSSPTTASRRP
jgi:hypothetical protein